MVSSIGGRNRPSRFEFNQTTIADISCAFGHGSRETSVEMCLISDLSDRLVTYQTVQSSDKEFPGVLCVFNRRIALAITHFRVDKSGGVAYVKAS